MSDKPLIIKCKFFNIRPDEMEEVRKTIKKQMEEATPVVMLPCGFELAEVNVELLEEIKAELQNEKYKSNNTYYAMKSVGLSTAIRIIDKHIAELKGENNDIRTKYQSNT